MALIGEETWISETPTKGKSIDGQIDLRNEEKILEIKTPIYHKKQKEQVELYLQKFWRQHWKIKIS